MDTILQLTVIYIMIMERCLCGMVLPSFHWNMRNPLFQKHGADGEKKLCRDPGHLYVDHYSNMYFLCPSLIVDVAKANSRLKRELLFENIHLVTEDGFNKCEVDQSNSLILMCNNPNDFTDLKFELVQFFDFNIGGWMFYPNNTYYFINTSNGTKESLGNKSGGRCKTHNMKLKVTVCDAAQECNKCKDMCCEKPPTTPPPPTTTTASTTQTTTQTTQKITTKAETVKTSEKQSVVTPSVMPPKSATTQTGKRKENLSQTPLPKNNGTIIRATTMSPSSPGHTESNGLNKWPEFKSKENPNNSSALKSTQDSDVNKGYYIGIGIVIGIIPFVVLVLVFYVRRKWFQKSEDEYVSQPVDQIKNVNQTRLPSPHLNGVDKGFYRLQSVSSTTSGSSRESKPYPV